VRSLKINLQQTGHLRERGLPETVLTFGEETSVSRYRSLGVRREKVGRMKPENMKTDPSFLATSFEMLPRAGSLRLFCNGDLPNSRR